MTISTQNQLLTPGEAARILNVNVNTVRRWCDRGIIEHTRIGVRGDRRISLDYILSLISSIRIKIRETITRSYDEGTMQPSYIKES